MKMFAPETYATFTATLKALRARGVRPGIIEMGWAADLALELGRDEPDAEVVRVLRERLGLEGDDVVVEGAAES